MAFKYFVQLKASNLDRWHALRFHIAASWHTSGSHLEPIGFQHVHEQHALLWLYQLVCWCIILHDRQNTVRVLCETAALDSLWMVQQVADVSKTPQNSCCDIQITEDALPWNKITINLKVITQTETYWHLEITFSETLALKEHIQQVVASCSAKIGLL